MTTFPCSRSSPAVTSVFAVPAQPDHPGISPTNLPYGHVFQLNEPYKPAHASWVASSGTCNQAASSRNSYRDHIGHIEPYFRAHSLWAQPNSTGLSSLTAPSCYGGQSLPSAVSKYSSTNGDRRAISTSSPANIDPSSFFAFAPFGCMQEGQPLQQLRQALPVSPSQQQQSSPQEQRKEPFHGDLQRRQSHLTTTSPPN